MEFRYQSDLSDQLLRRTVRLFSSSEMSATLNPLLLEGIVPQSIEKEKRHVLVKIIRNWRENLVSDDSGQASVILYSLGNLSDKVTLIAISLCASLGVWVPQISVPSPKKYALADCLYLIFGAKRYLSPNQIKAQLIAKKVAVFSVPKPLLSPKKAWEFSPFQPISAHEFNREEGIKYIMALVYMSGAKGVVFDIRVEGNSFVQNQKEGRNLACRIKDICCQLGIHSSYIFCNTNHFIGQAIGNSLEIEEALEVLRGRGPLDLKKAAVEVASEMVRLAYPLSKRAEIKKSLKRKIEGGEALEIFKEMILSQEGNPLYVDDNSLFPKGKKGMPILSEREGFIHNLDENKVVSLRSKLSIRPENPGTGLTILKKRGDRIRKGDLLAEIFHDGLRGISALNSRFMDLFVISDTPPPFQPLIIEKIREEDLS